MSAELIGVRAADAGSTPRRRRVPAAVLLFFLSPLFGEYLLGNLRFSDLFLLPFLAVLYGAGAILIREISRRAGRGYATMLGLGVAYTLVEEGLVDQMIFNPDYFTGQREIMTTVIPALGLDAWLTLIVTGMHTVWSIVIPIVLVEGVFRGHGEEPWLGRVGLGVTAAIFVCGSIWLGHESHKETDFWATSAQLVGAAVVIAAIVAATFLIGRRAATPVAGFVPNPWLAGGIALVASSLFMLTEYLPGWTRVAACLLVAATFFASVHRWSGRSGWTRLHTLALAGGGIGTYAWLGAVMEPETGARTILDHAGTLVFIAVALGLLAIAVAKRRARP
jgi:hypothetical protein